VQLGAISLIVAVLRSWGLTAVFVASMLTIAAGGRVGRRSPVMHGEDGSAFPDTGGPPPPAATTSDTCVIDSGVRVPRFRHHCLPAGPRVSASS